MNVPVVCSYATAVVLEHGVETPRILLLRRAKEYLRGEWSSVAGSIEDGETAWQAALREVAEETGLEVKRLYATDYVEQYQFPELTHYALHPAL